MPIIIFIRTKFYHSKITKQNSSNVQVFISLNLDWETLLHVKRQFGQKRDIALLPMLSSHYVPTVTNPALVLREILQKQCFPMIQIKAAPGVVQQVQKVLLLKV